MMSPATASDMPASSSASVRGTRLTNNRRQARSASGPPRSASNDSCPAPRLTLAAHRTSSRPSKTASPAQPPAGFTCIRKAPCSRPCPYFAPASARATSSTLCCMAYRPALPSRYQL